MFEPTVRAGVCQLFRRGTRWLSTGWDGGGSHGDAAYNVTVPEGWPETDLAAYVASRREDADFDAPGPTLLTGVSQEHARRARLGSVEAVATAGVSNPAALPVESLDGDEHTTDRTDATDDSRPPGTVNVVVGTTHALAPGALPNLLTVAAEAKAATLLSVADVPGTTTDAVVAACDPDGSLASFSGSATPVGRAARACVRDAVLASLASRYAERSVPTVADAPYGVVTDVRATVTRL
ncbi:adenosylcobinamide amidohydrolase [Salinigranum rubrum]|uniref:Adenosylcobinamide amidohydrolase n=1 Tax=Salinigranum rubrum TaxID=755307 RepID=A0A2I8VPN0_9EURY|nr:adenosylcobinamide amidohydrolase [Salinigranum rubrum]AUV83855.1 adenosylcobinamide amidohydrolase [Salinigranum rubrum]